MKMKPSMKAMNEGDDLADAHHEGHEGEDLAEALSGSSAQPPAGQSVGSNRQSDPLLHYCT